MRRFAGIDRGHAAPIFVSPAFVRKSSYPKNLSCTSALQTTLPIMDFEAGFEAVSKSETRRKLGRDMMKRETASLVQSAAQIERADTPLLV